MPVQLRGGHTAVDPRLGRVPEFDSESRNYAVRAIVDKTKLRGRSWIIKDVLDQGNSSACTGFSAGYDLMATPAPEKGITAGVCHALYKDAQRLDEWAGEDYEGSSVLGACKAMMQAGYIGQYRWAFGIDDMLLALSHVGPVVVGTDWTNSMFRPKPNGLLTVDRVRGQVAGGHAYIVQSIILSYWWKKFLLGFNEDIRDEPLLRIHNSWGNGWGKNGDGLMWASDMAALLEGIAYPGEARITTTPFKRS